MNQKCYVATYTASPEPIPNNEPRFPNQNVRRTLIVAPSFSAAASAADAERKPGEGLGLGETCDPVVFA